MRKQSFYGLVALLALLVSVFAITNQSLWIDEGSAALKAMEPSLGGWWQNLRSEGNSNLQLIGELFYLWGWEKIFGSSEVALRASNIPFFVAGVMALAWGMGNRRRLQSAIVLVALTNAFLWYYLSEARPYIVLFAFTAITSAALFRLLEAREEMLTSRLWFAIFCSGILGLCATSLIAVPWALGALAAAFYWSGPRLLAKALFRFKGWSALLLFGLGALGLYYLWTLRAGARASDVGRTSWSNVAYIFYELLGLAGLGPGRNTLRTEGATAVVAFLQLLVPAAVATLGSMVAGLTVVWQKSRGRQIVFFAIAVGTPFILVLAAGSVAHMRLVGRHLTPLLPYLLALVAVSLAHLFSSHALWKRAAALIALSLLFVSSLLIRFAPRHQRDDYRAAAALAQQAADSGQRVWWLADVATGRYYDVALTTAHVTASPEFADSATIPNLIVLSKPDIYDSTGAARTYLARHAFRVKKSLAAFEIFARPSPGPAPSKSPGKSGE